MTYEGRSGENGFISPSVVVVNACGQGQGQDQGLGLGRGLTSEKKSERMIRLIQ